MGSSEDRLFNRQKTVHQILGGGLGVAFNPLLQVMKWVWILWDRDLPFNFVFSLKTVADIMLWRRENLNVGMLVVTLAAWLVFEKSGRTLSSLVSSVLLLLVTILFLSAKSAAILNW